MNQFKFLVVSVRIYASARSIEPIRGLDNQTPTKMIRTQPDLRMAFNSYFTRDALCSSVINAAKTETLSAAHLTI